MTQDEFIKKVSAQTGEPETQVRKILEGMMVVTSNTIKENQEIRLPDFGIMKPKFIKGRRMVNPFTKEEFYTEDKTTVMFKPFKKFFFFGSLH